LQHNYAWMRFASTPFSSGRIRQAIIYVQTVCWGSQRAFVLVATRAGGNDAQTRRAATPRRLSGTTPPYTCAATFSEPVRNLDSSRERARLPPPSRPRHTNLSVSPSLCSPPGMFFAD
jgi:hypothetical protein